MRRSVSILIFLFLIAAVVFSHSGEVHNQEYEYVLFGNRFYKYTNPSAKKIIQTLEDASFICIDQFNGSGAKELANLKEENIPNMIKSIDEIDFKAFGGADGKSGHRYYTHRGWDLYYPEKSHWETRKAILVNTVKKKLFPSLIGFSSFFARNRQLERQCNSFCILTYYVHILGDHLEARDYKSLSDIARLSDSHDKTNPGIIPSIKNSSKDLFFSQVNDGVYKLFISKLDDLQLKSENLLYSVGQINTDDKFVEYHKCAEELLECLAFFVPKLLKKESFFFNAFYR